MMAMYFLIFVRVLRPRMDYDLSPLIGGASLEL